MNHDAAGVPVSIVLVGAIKNILPDSLKVFVELVILFIEGNETFHGDVVFL